MNTATANDNAGVPNVIAPKLFRRELPCKLSNDESIRYGSMLSSKVRERDMLDDQRKTVAAEYSSKIKTVTTDISRIAAALDKGEELRSIDCYQEFRSGVMHTIRTDTGATVEVRPATLADRQAELPGPNGTSVAPTATDFPDIDEGPSGDEMPSPASDIPPEGVDVPGSSDDDLDQELGEIAPPEKPAKKPRAKRKPKADQK